MDNKAVAEHISGWMASYLAASSAGTFVIGISGGVDSAVSSTLAALTGCPVLCVTLPIHQPASHMARAAEHIAMLQARFPGVASAQADLTQPYETFMEAFPPDGDENRYLLNGANVRSRLRMTALYYFAGLHGGIVVGTGNKIEDFGVGFFTKYGDGGVDISPIADLTKTQVFELGTYLGIPRSILDAPPTDGLFGDDRTDEQQIGATYPELEWAMEQAGQGISPEAFTGRQREVYDIYLRRNRANRHKMTSPPVCIVPEELK